MKHPDEPNGHRRSGNGATPEIALDDRGLVKVGAVSAHAEVEPLAAAVCDSLGRLLATRITPVAVEVVRQDPHWLGLTMLREQGPEGVRFRSGTAVRDTGPEAIVAAIMKALGADRGVLTAMADRWATRPDVHAVMVVQGVEITAQAGPSEDGDRQWQLVRSLPAPGRLALATDETEHRVLRLPAAALALSASVGAGVLHEVDQWMLRVEETRNG